MARFRTQPGPGPAPNPAASRQPTPFARDSERDDDRSPTGGPGWFDSSWDLIRGLEVREGLPADAGLGEWLDVWLGPRFSTGSARTERHEQPRSRLVPPAPHGSLVDPLQPGDLRLVVATEVAHLDEFREFRIEHLELA